MIVGIIAILILTLLTVIAFWQKQPVIFMVLTGMGIALGLASPDVMSSVDTTTPLDLTIAISLIGYGLLCAGQAFRLMLWRDEI